MFPQVPGAARGRSTGSRCNCQPPSRGMATTCSRPGVEPRCPDCIGGRLDATSPPLRAISAGIPKWPQGSSPGAPRLPGSVSRRSRPWATTMMVCLSDQSFEWALRAAAPSTCRCGRVPEWRFTGGRWLRRCEWCENAARRERERMTRYGKSRATRNVGNAAHSRFPGAARQAGALHEMPPHGRDRGTARVWTTHRRQGRTTDGVRSAVPDVRAAAPAAATHAGASHRSRVGPSESRGSDRAPGGR